MGNQTHHPKRITRVQRGFTLIELLVVVAIISLLMAILIPALSGARESARRAACSSNQRQIALAIIAYTSENSQTLPGPCIACVNDPRLVNSIDGVSQSQMTQWASGDTYHADRELSNTRLLQNYLGGATAYKVWVCPSNQAMWENASPYNASSIFNGKKLGYGYMVNNTTQTKSTFPAWLFGTYNNPANQPTQWANSPQDWKPKKLSEIRARIGPSTARDDVVTESLIWILSDLDGRNWGKEFSGTFGIVNGASGDSSTAKDKRPYQPIHSTNQGRPNGYARVYTFLDGHSELLRFNNWPNNDVDE